MAGTMNTDRGYIDWAGCFRTVSHSTYMGQASSWHYPDMLSSCVMGSSNIPLAPGMRYVLPKQHLHRIPAACQCKWPAKKRRRIILKANAQLEVTSINHSFRAHLAHTRCLYWPIWGIPKAIKNPKFSIVRYLPFPPGGEKKSVLLLIFGPYKFAHILIQTHVGMIPLLLPSCPVIVTVRFL